MKGKGQTLLLKLTFSGMSLALCLLLPFLTANSQQLGNILCLMHIPVLLCGVCCGWKYGMAVGVTAPLLRNLLFGMPPFPTVALPMAAELAIYGLVSGLAIWRKSKCIPCLYANLITSMVLGRIVSVAVKYAMYELGSTQFTFSAALQMTFVTTLPGVALQLVLIPALVYALNKQGVIRHFE